jgi:hypothetical protein
MQISKAQAVRFLLRRHHLSPPRRLNGKDGVISLIRRLRCIQFDPLDKAGTNPLLVLQSRVANFTPELLEELLYRDRLLIEGFDKNLSIYHREDFPAFAREREAADARFLAPGSPVLDALPAVRKEIRQRGPLSSQDIHLNERVDWPWAPARLGRAALESLYFRGELVIHRREKRRKHYDLSERHLPATLLEKTDPFACDEDYLAWRVERRIAGIGLVPDRPGDAWLGIRGLSSRVRSEILERLHAEGRAAAVEIEGSSCAWYAPADELPLLREAIGGGEGEAAASNSASGRNAENPEAAFLAPLDNLLWDRRMIEELFGFSYRWEVYKPAAERQYGYYVLPVLYGDRFVARFEPERSAERNVLWIKNWWWEPDIEPDGTMRAALRSAFTQFLNYLGVEAIETNPQANRTMFKAMLPITAPPG